MTSPARDDRAVLPSLTGLVPTRCVRPSDKSLGYFHSLLFWWWRWWYEPRSFYRINLYLFASAVFRFRSVIIVETKIPIFDAWNFLLR